MIYSANERLWREQQNDTGAWVQPTLGMGDRSASRQERTQRLAVSSAVAGTVTVMLLAVIVQLLFAGDLTFTGGVAADRSLNFVQCGWRCWDLVTF
jgi:hypothetical protein